MVVMRQIERGNSDFWESFTFEMPRNLDYEFLYARLAWDLPTNRDIVVHACGRHAKGRGNLALIHNHRDGTVRRWIYYELKREGRQGGEDFVGVLQGLVKERLSAHEYPREAEFVGELPKAATGEIKRNVLRGRDREVQR